MDDFDSEDDVTTIANSSVAADRHAFVRLLGVALGLGAAIFATYVVPPLAPLRPWVPGHGYIPFWNVVGRELRGEGAVAEAERTPAAALAPVIHRAPLEPPPAPRIISKSPGERPLERTVPAYVSPSESEPPRVAIEPRDALDAYFRKLTLVDLKVPGTVARTGHYGDSVLGLDGITSGIRRRLQSRFGDAGHGFHLLDRYHPSYRHQGIDFEPGEGWLRCLVVYECDKRYRRYGYGGLVVRSSGGATATFGSPRRDFGDAVSRFELWYSRLPSGGKLEIVVDGDRRVSVDTRGAALEDAWEVVEVPRGRHTFMVRAAGGGEVRAYGAVLENDGPGVVWDGLALIGGSTRGLRTVDPEHLASQIRRRDLDLVVLMFGGNDMERNYVDLKESMEPYYEEYLEVLDHLRAGKPGLPCLVMSLLDHGKRLPDGSIASRSFVKTLVAAQAEIARRAGCGFFDTFKATGGEGTAARWFRASPRLVAPDLGHPTGLGHELIAELLVRALLDAYADYRHRITGQPLAELERSAGVAPQREGSSAPTETP
ncbi:MAG TPA: GDSL-type esterase/lipase family protein [Polyangiaceae bacterium]|nr:GDSL-type esterase/lipase family protein [Polyangiaceae bacterium]